MAEYYTGNSAVTSRGVLGNLGDMLSSVGKFMFTATAMAGAAYAAVTWVPNAITSLGGVFDARIFSNFGELATSYAPAAMVFGGITAAGGALKGIQSLRDGKPKLALKQTLVGIAEGLAIGGVMLAGITALPVAGALYVGAEAVSLLSKGNKTLASRFGDLVGGVLDTVLGVEEFGASKVPARGASVSPLQYGGNDLAMAAGVGMPVMAAAAPQLSYGSLPPYAGAGFSAVDAGVGYTAPELTQSRHFRDQIMAERAGRGAQGPSRLPPQMAGQYADAVSFAEQAYAEPNR